MSNEICVMTKDDFSNQIREALINRLPSESTNVDIFLSFFLSQLDTKPKEKEIFKKNPAESIVILTKIMAMKLPLTTHDMYYLTTYKLKNKDGTYTEKIQLQVSYFGMMELAYKAGILSISSQEVYEKDTFECSLGTDPYINHKVNFGNRGKLIGYYCVAKTQHKTFVEIMSIQQMQDFSKKFAKTESIWNMHFDAMARKTLIKKILKVCPKTPQLMEAIKADDEAEYYNDEELSLIGSDKNKSLPLSHVPISQIEMKILIEKIDHAESLEKLQDLWKEWHPRLLVSSQEDKIFLYKHKEATKEILLNELNKSKELEITDLNT